MLVLLSRNNKRRLKRIQYVLEKSFDQAFNQNDVINIVVENVYRFTLTTGNEELKIGFSNDTREGKDAAKNI
jgi:hypothetical protein